MATTPRVQTPVAIDGSDTFAAHVHLTNGDTIEIIVKVQDLVLVEGQKNADGTQRYDFKSSVGARVVSAPVEAAANG